MTQWKFRFDASYLANGQPFWRASDPLSVQPFSRGVATVDPAGNPVAADNPRFALPTRIAPLLPNSQILPFPESRVLASGLAYDGATPITVLQNEDMTRVDVLAGPNNTLKSTVLESTSLAQSTVGYPGYPGLTTYAIRIDPQDESGPRIVPQSAVVAHGLIVLGGVYLQKMGPLPDFTVKGFGFLVSLNEGQTWTHLWNDSAQSDPDVNHWRGREWCLHVSFALDMAEHPDNCWVAATDYRVQRNDNTNTPPPEGGRVTLIRFSRSFGSSGPWSWVPGASGNPFTYFIGAGSSLVATGCHLHSAHVAQYGDTGLQMIVSVGDAQPHSRFVRFTIDNVSTADYANPANWNVDGGDANTPPDGFHGFRQTTALGSRSQQPVGIAIGPRTWTFKPFSSTNPATRSTLIWGGDEQAEVLTRMVLPEPGDSPNQLWVEHLYGFNTGFGSNYEGDFSRLHGIVFSLAQARPEKADVEWAAPLVAVLSNADDSNSMTRVLYCPDPVQNPTMWMQLATRWGSSPGTAVVHGSKVYFVSYGDHTGGLLGVRSIDVSGIDANTATIFKPIIVAPGGKNLAVQSNFLKKGDQWTSNNTKPLPMMANPATPSLPPVGVDSITGLGTRFLPPLPCVSARIFRVQTKRTIGGAVPNRFICRIHLSGTSDTNWNQFPANSGWQTGSLVRRIRCWVLDGSWGVLTGANGPNKTAQMSMRTRTGFDTAEDPPIPKGAPLLYSCSNRWCPLTIIGFREVPDDSPLHKKDGISIEFLCASDSEPSHPPDDNYLYLAIDGAFDGNGSLPYPIGFSQAGTAPDEKPPELLTLSLGSATGGYPLSFGSNWTLKLAGQMPIGNWDQYAERKTPGDPNSDIRYWPLATLWSDADNWIELVANCKDKAFQLRYKSGGGEPVPHNFGVGDQLWLPDSTLMVAISWDATSKRLYFGASLAGGVVAAAPDDGILVQSWNGQTAPLSQLKFRGVSDEVVEFRWIGGEVTDQPMTSTEIKASAFNSIDFMKGPPV